MKRIDLKDILKEIVLNYEFANPLCDEFSEKEFLLKYEHFLKEEYKEFKILNQGNGKEIIDIVIELNYLYDNLIIQMEELIDKINLNTIELIEQVLAILNYGYFSFEDSLLSKISDDKSKLPKSFDEDTNRKFKNIFGDDIDIQDAADISVDTCIFLFQIILSFKPQKKKDIPVLEKEKQFNLTRNLIFIANIFANIENAFKFYKYEFGDIIRKKDAIVFKRLPELFYTLQLIGKQRYSNLITESSFYAYNYFNKKTLVPELRVSNSTIQIIKYKEGENPQDLFRSSVFVTFYYHLDGIKLKYFENITVFELIKILNDLQTCFQCLNPEEIVKSAYENQENKYIPYKIKRNELIRYLTLKSGQRKEIISKILNTITSTLNEIPDLWSTPLIQVVDYYYFIIPSIANAHIAYLLDKILQKTLSYDKQSKAFKQLIIKELNIPLDNGYKFEFIDDERLNKISNALEDNIIILTQDNLIILEPCIYPFSIQSIENHSNLLRLSNASDTLNKKIEIVKTNIPQFTKKDKLNIYGIVITNHTLFSGMYLNYNHILDYHLLKNYFIVGELRQGKVVFGKSEIHTQELAGLKYYKNEEEFNNNLKEFLFKPGPIFDKIKNYVHKEYLIVPKEMEPQIFSDGVEILPLNSRIWELINEVEYYLNQLYYFEKDYNELNKEKRFFEDKITFYLPQIFSSIAFEQDRTIKIDVLNKFKNSSLQSFSYMVFIFQNSLSQVGKVKITKNVERPRIEYENEDVQKILETLLSKNINDSNLINLSRFELKHDLDKDTFNKLMNHLIDLLSTFSQKNYSEDELNNYLLLISIFLTLSKGKKEFKRELYSIIFNYVDSLNFNNYHQQARDFSEGILEFSLQEEDIPIIGWLCLFKCYSKQYNHYDAIFYGNIFISALTTLPEVEEFIILETLYNSLIFYRNFGFHHYVDDIYSFLKDLPVNEYEKQKFTLSYYNSRLQHDYSKLNILYQDTVDYLNRNINGIIKYGEKVAFPWVGFILNLKNLYKHGLIDDISLIEEYYVKLKSNINPDTVADLELKFYPDIKRSKELLTKTLIKVFETRYFEDLASELNELQLLAKNVISISLDPIDLKSLLLAGLIINDNSLTFLKKESHEFAPLFNKNANVTSSIDNYSKNILENLYIKESQIIIWLFEIETKVFFLTINAKKECEVKPLNNWNFSKMRSWLSNITDFYYYNKKGGFFINEQETEYLKILQETDFAVISDLPLDKEILIYSSLQLSEFPHNLLQTNSSEKSDTFFEHEEVVKDYIKSKSDFISFNTGISNIISIDWFAEYGKEIHLKRKELKIEAWIPTVDDDTNIYIGYDKLRPIIEDLYKGKVHTGIFPEKEINSSINVFMAHGGKGMEGFRTIYTRNFEGRAITKEYGLKKLFGTGEIAVLFICNSASISKEIYSQQLISFTNTILSLGYKAVIAPAWSLFTDISPIWLKVFLNELSSGFSVGKSVFKANLRVAKNGYDECYYTPTGWAAMHLYGNPNISFDDDSE
jgi:hypothetical protein